MKKLLLLCLLQLSITPLLDAAAAGYGAGRAAINLPGMVERDGSMPESAGAEKPYGVCVNAAAFHKDHGDHGLHSCCYERIKEDYGEHACPKCICTICMDLLDTDVSKVKKFPACSHAFHTECYQGIPLSEGSIKCPLCRARGTGVGRIAQGGRALAAWQTISVTVSGYTLLHIAAELGNVEWMRRLLRAGMSIEERDNWGHTPLYHASVRGNITALSFLLDNLAENRRGVLITELNRQTGDSVFHQIIGAGNLMIVTTMLDKLSPEDRLLVVSHADGYGNTPLHYAVRYGRKAIVELLLRYLSVDQLEARNQLGQRALDIAKDKVTYYRAPHRLGNFSGVDLAGGTDECHPREILALLQAHLVREQAIRLSWWQRLWRRR